LVLRWDVQKVILPKMNLDIDLKTLNQIIAVGLKELLLMKISRLRMVY
jgi:hypothetical protein